MVMGSSHLARGVHHHVVRLRDVFRLRAVLVSRGAFSNFLNALR